MLGTSSITAVSGISSNRSGTAMISVAEWKRLSQIASTIKANKAKHIAEASKVAAAKGQN